MMYFDRIISIKSTEGSPVHITHYADSSSSVYICRRFLAQTEGDTGYDYNDISYYVEDYLEESGNNLVTTTNAVIPT